MKNRFDTMDDVFITFSVQVEDCDDLEALAEEIASHLNGNAQFFTSAEVTHFFLDSYVSQNAIDAELACQD